MYHKMKKVKTFMVILAILIVGSQVYSHRIAVRSIDKGIPALRSGESSRSSTHVYDNITKDTTWNKEDNPYMISNAIYILNDATLTIEPGVNISFSESGALLGGPRKDVTGEWTSSESIGNINAIGTVEDKITFSYGGDVYLDDRMGLGASLYDRFIFESCEFYSIGKITLFGSDDCIFNNCNFYGDTGIVINKADGTGGDQYPNNNTITNCNFVNNYNSIIIGSGASNPKLPNRFYQNNFINCLDPLQPDTPPDGYKDIWNNSTGHGNYWYNYDGIDTNVDGIGDTDLPWEGFDSNPLMDRLPIVNEANQSWVIRPTP